MKKLSWSKTLFAVALAILLAVGPASAEPWKFGVMSDTQWTPNSANPATVATSLDPAGTNPNAVSKSIIDQINPKFIEAGVKFVIQVGDLTEFGNDADIAERAKAAQPLIDAGIGFFPMRGNHETYANPANNFGIPAFQASFPQTQGNKFIKSNGHEFRRGKHFSSPTLVSMDLAGMSYSFDYGHRGNNARFVILDNWVTPSKGFLHANGYNYGYSFGDQQAWISSRLDKNTRDTEHAFVFSHQPLMAENHQDSPFIGYTDANPDMQDAFFKSLQANDVKFYISGHDHIHQRSVIKSPNGKSAVQEIIGASNSSKFYTPKALADPKWYGQKVRETSLSQERYTVGYYIYTVDGSCVTVDYYSDDHGSWQSDNCYPSGGGTPQSCPAAATPGSHVTPTFNFVKKETWGYCQNGQEFLVPQGATYELVQDRFEGTTAKILHGTNNSTATDYTNRPFTKTVNTGWVDIDGWCRQHPAHIWNNHFDLASDIFKLQGMTDLGKTHTDPYVLSLSYDHHRLLPIQLGKGLLGLVTRDENGHWINAVDKNEGGTKKFVVRPYKSGDELGTYGVDLKTRTVWAVINHDGDFAAAGFKHFED
ncbi:MAG TPA: metallophosphoesterase [Syntrophales bacterium]|nr:metallophosphoesterase [Syntrophales bacterium]